MWPDSVCRDDCGAWVGVHALRYGKTGSSLAGKGLIDVAGRGGIGIAGVWIYYYMRLCTLEYTRVKRLIE